MVIDISMNINDWVLVKLNENGIAELERQYDQLKQSLQSLGEFEINKDEDGYTQFQLHDLMCRLGHLCKLGFEPPFETEIKIKTK